MSTYSDKLKDPRWQKKRLEILQRDKWTCQYCGDTSNTLNVHHKDYFSSTNPWDYPDELLVTTCEQCNYREYMRKELEESLIHNFRKHFSFVSLSLINDALASTVPNNPLNSYKLSQLIRRCIKEPYYRILLLKTWKTKGNKWLIKLKDDISVYDSRIGSGL